MERTARTAAAERTGSFFMNDMDRFPSLYKYHACGRRQKNCIQSAAMQFKSNIRETWRVILVSEADKSYQSHCVSSRDRNNRVTVHG